MPAPPDLVSREELLGGLPARRAAMLLFAIEGRTARLVDRSRRAMAPGVTERTAEERERAFLQALAEGRDLPLRPTIQDIERYAPAWASLVPPHPAMRAAVIHAMAERYTFTSRAVPALRRALGLDEAAVEQGVERAANLEFADVDAFGAFGALRSVSVDLPASRARALKLRAHRVTSEGDSEPLSVAVELRDGTDARQVEVDGLALVPFDGAACRVHVSFLDHA